MIKIELVFKNELLSNDLVETSDLIVYQSGDLVHLNSVNDEIQQIEVYDLLGREIFKKSNVNEKELTVLNLISNEQALVVKMIFSNGKIVSRKVVY